MTKYTGKIKTDYLVTVIEHDLANRVVVTFQDPRMCKFLQENNRYVVSAKHNLIQVSGSEKGKPYASELLPEISRCALRCLHELIGERHLESLATEAQLVRARQLAGILAGRVDNSIFLPANPDKLTHGQIGRWLRDAKNILIAEGRWDEEAKCEIPKRSRPRRSRKSK